MSKEASNRKNTVSENKEESSTPVVMVSNDCCLSEVENPQIPHKPKQKMGNGMNVMNFQEAMRKAFEAQELLEVYMAHMSKQMQKMEMTKQKMRKMSENLPNSSTLPEELKFSTSSSSESDSQSEDVAFVKVLRPSRERGCHDRSHDRANSRSASRGRSRGHSRGPSREHSQGSSRNNSRGRSVDVVFVKNLGPHPEFGRRDRLQYSRGHCRSYSHNHHRHPRSYGKHLHSHHHKKMMMYPHGPEQWAIKKKNLHKHHGKHQHEHGKHLNWMKNHNHGFSIHV